MNQLRLKKPKLHQVAASVRDTHQELAIYEFGSGPTLILLHGVPGGPAVWFDVARRLSDRYQVLVPALLGFDESSRPREREMLLAPAQAEALDHALATFEIDSALFVGHDFGVPVGLALHARRPELFQGFAAFATNVFPDTPIPFPLSVINLPVIGKFAREALFSRPSLRMMLRQGTGRPRPKIDPSTYLGDRAQSKAIASIFAHSLVNLKTAYAPTELEAKKVAVPTFVGWGTRDPFFNVDHGHRTAEAFGIELTLYPSAGHFLPEERPIELANDLHTFATSTPIAR